MTCQELTEALENATGLDRELDLAIHLALNPDGDIAKIVSNPTYRRGLDGEAGYAWGFGPLGTAILFEKYTDDGRCTYNGGYLLPAYTASIDAALTLVPEGFAMLFSTHGRQSRKPFVCCSSLKPIDQRSKHLPEKIFNVEAETLPLALCIAALRARAALEGTK